MVNTEIRLSIFFAAKDGEALYSQQKQDQELTVAQTMSLIAKFRPKLKKPQTGNQKNKAKQTIRPGHLDSKLYF